MIEMWSFGCGSNIFLFEKRKIVQSGRAPKTEFQPKKTKIRL